MSFQDWSRLAVTSVRDPATAARTLMGMGFPANMLWSALVLVSIGNTVMFALSDALLPSTTTPIPAMFRMPFTYFAIVAGGLALTVLSLFWVGRTMGGRASLADLLVLIVWMQTLRLAVQVAVLVLVFVLPLLSAMLVLAAALVGVYMLVHFVDQAHRFASPGRAVVVLVLSLLAIVVGLSFILTLVGGFTVGSTLNV